MKKFILYTLMAGTLGLASCEKKLDLLNPQAVDAELAYGTDTKVKQVLIGIYGELGSGDLFGGNTQWLAELMGSNGDATWDGTFPDPRAIWGKSIATNNSYVSGLYTQAYRVIALTNNVLASLDVVNDADKARVEGEAKFIRGLVYFELIKFFGEKSYSAAGAGSLRGVPLVTDPRPGSQLSSDNFVPRSTIDEVYTQIISDLTTAETNLAPRNSFYANKPSASLALARVYLQMLNYEAARDAADRCITVASANAYSLVATYANEFNTTANTTEDLFAMQVNTQSGTNSNQTFYSTSDNGARDLDIEINEVFLNKFTAGDARRNMYIAEGDAFFCAKWRDPYTNVKVFRLAEAFLTRAEANVRLGSATGATVSADLAMTRTRAGLALIAAPSLTDVLAERELEIAFEGQAFADAKRLRLTTDGLAYDAPKMVWPIPQRETNIYD
ncbi:MAG: RagB/SusD family nutrient uptake outer membrane protein, partial [Cytophagaceae bacterium]